MKKTLAISLVVVYCLSILCVGFSIHCCGGHFGAISFVKSKDDACCGGKKMPVGCCKDIQVKFKKDDQSLSKSLYFIPSKDKISINITNSTFDQSLITNHLVASIYSIGKPPNSTIRLHLLNGVFRI